MGERFSDSGPAQTHLPLELGREFQPGRHADVGSGRGHHAPHLIGQAANEPEAELGWAARRSGEAGAVVADDQLGLAVGERM